jgi:TonB-linked SusC/RagA family outer membrane protein
MNMNKLFIFLFKMLVGIFLLLPYHLFAQPQTTISGKITDESGDPLPGVTIVIEGTTMGITSDAGGFFVLSVPGENPVLSFSMIGFESQRIIIGKQRLLDIVMKESVSELDEVVVVGYGTQRKVSVTGAIASIQTKELKQSSAANFSNALAGRLPGLTLLQVSGKPGEDNYDIYLRGRGTLNGYDPLILIDGVPRSDLNVLDPNEVASVSILKDASATAVFGVRGANGVILITTRRGETGKAELSISVDQSMQSFTARPDRIHSWEFAELRNQAARNDGSAESDLPFTPYMIDRYKSGDNPVFYPDRDIFHEYFNDYAPQTRINANMNGGTENLHYFCNAGYTGQGGLINTAPESQLGYDPSMRLDRFNFRANTDYEILKNLKLSLNLATYLDKINSPAIEGAGLSSTNELLTRLMAYSYYTPPSQPGPLTVGGYGVPAGKPMNNTYMNLSLWNDINGGYHEETATSINTSFVLDWGLDFITGGLSAKFMISYDKKARTIIEGVKDMNLYTAYVATSAGEKSYYSAIQETATESLSLSKRFGAYYYMNLQYSLNYARQFGRHELSAMALFQRDNWQNQNWQANTDLPYNMLGLVGRITYGYDSRYLAEVNLGYNGSEQFAPKNRFGFFPAFSAGWVISNETFLKDNPLLTHLKLRASYGRVGNDKMGGDRFLYNSVLSQNGGGSISSLNYGNWIYHGRQGNETLQWEIAGKQNYGLDLQLFRCLSLNVDVYSEVRDKILITRSTVPIIQGIELGLLPKANMGKVENKGYEMELTYQKRFNSDLNVVVKGNFAYNRNKILFADEPLLAEDYTWRYRSTGFSIGQPFGYLIDYSNGNGYINTEEELNGLLPYQVGGNPRLGDFIYVDTNGDGIISNKDMVPVGYTNIPRITYGLSGNVSWKHFDLSLLFTGIAKSSIQHSDLYVTEFGLGGAYSNLHKEAWTPERYANGEKISYPALGITSGSSTQSNSFYIWDRSFLRLKNLEIGYTLPEKLTQPVGISHARLYLNGNNLYTWDKFPFNTIDPEQTTARTYPIMKMVNVGVNVVF